jgi:hypothetical protein
LSSLNLKLPVNKYVTKTNFYIFFMEAAPQPTHASVAPTTKNNDPREYVQDLRWQVKTYHAELDRVRSNSGHRAPSPGTTARTEDPHHETTSHPPSAVTIADTEPGYNTARSTAHYHQHEN